MTTNELVSPTTVYWITRLDAIQAMFGFLIAGGFIVGTILAVVGNVPWEINGYNETERERERAEVAKAKAKFRRLSIAALCLGGVSILGAVLTPSTKDAVAIAVIPAIANNQDVQGLGADLVTTAREWLQELRPVVKEGGK